MGRWKPPPTEDPLTLAHRQLGEVESERDAALGLVRISEALRLKGERSMMNEITKLATARTFRGIEFGKEMAEKEIDLVRLTKALDEAEINYRIETLMHRAMYELAFKLAGDSDDPVAATEFVKRADKELKERFVGRTSEDGITRRLKPGVQRARLDESSEAQGDGGDAKAEGARVREG